MGEGPCSLDGEGFMSKDIKSGSAKFPVGFGDDDDDDDFSRCCWVLMLVWGVFGGVFPPFLLLLSPPLAPAGDLPFPLFPRGRNVMRKSSVLLARSDLTPPSNSILSKLS